MMNKLWAMYFSPTGTTKKIVEGMAQDIRDNISGISAIDRIDFTLPGVRRTETIFTTDDLVVFGVPVYAGRVPNVLLKYFRTIKGNGALAVPVVVYGNRAYDDALIELKDLLEEDGFRVIAACAFIGEHSFSKVLAQGRPDEQDMAVVSNFAKQIARKITAEAESQPIAVKGQKPYRNYYVPKDQEGKGIDIRKVKPETSSACNSCKICVEVCPMGSIDPEDPSRITGICIKCGACEKKCPVQAKYFTDPGYLWHKQDIENKYSWPRKEPELFI